MAAFFADRPVPVKFRRQSAHLGDALMQPVEVERLTRFATRLDLFTIPGLRVHVRPIAVIPMRNELGEIVAYDVPVD